MRSYTNDLTSRRTAFSSDLHHVTDDNQRWIGISLALNFRALFVGEPLENPGSTDRNSVYAWARVSALRGLAVVYARTCLRSAGRWNHCQITATIKILCPREPVHLRPRKKQHHFQEVEFSGVVF